MEETGKYWYVVRAIGGQEKKIQMLIESEIARMNLEHIVSQILVPTEKVYQIRNGKKVSKEKNYFPGYILVEINGKITPETVSQIRDVNGVVGFLGTKKGKVPVPLRKEEVNKLLGKVDELADKEEENHIPYIIGESIKIIDGPFNSFIGIIEEVNEERKKLKVMVKIFGRKTPVELNYLQVEKIQNL